MATITVDEEKLEEVVEKVVEKKLSLTFQDVDEVRKSPAGAIIRIEGKIEKIEDQIKDIKENMATKDEVHSIKTLVYWAAGIMIGLLISIEIKIFFG
jgi:hypothetical protein